MIPFTLHPHPHLSSQRRGIPPGLFPPPLLYNILNALDYSSLPPFPSHELCPIKCLVWPLSPVSSVSPSQMTAHVNGSPSPSRSSLPRHLKTRCSPWCRLMRYFPSNFPLFSWGSHPASSFPSSGIQFCFPDAPLLLEIYSVWHVSPSV